MHSVTPDWARFFGSSNRCLVIARGRAMGERKRKKHQSRDKTAQPNTFSKHPPRTRGHGYSSSKNFLCYYPAVFPWSRRWKGPTKLTSFFFFPTSTYCSASAYWESCRESIISIHPPVSEKDLSRHSFNSIIGPTVAPVYYDMPTIQKATLSQ